MDAFGQQQIFSGYVAYYADAREDLVNCLPGSARLIEQARPPKAAAVDNGKVRKKTAVKSSSKKRRTASSTPYEGAAAAPAAPKAAGPAAAPPTSTPVDNADGDSDDDEVIWRENEPGNPRSYDSAYYAVKCCMKARTQRELVTIHDWWQRGYSAVVKAVHERQHQLCAGSTNPEVAKLKEEVAKLTRQNKQLRICLHAEQQKTQQLVADAG